MNHPGKNVLLIVLDQVICDTLSLYGGKVCKTPNIDAMFGDGFIFENAYTPISLCSPARASLFTGKMPANHGVLCNVGNDFYTRREIQTPDAVITRQLLPAGYRCGYAGKWHIGCANGPREYGFQGTSIAGYGFPGFVPEYDEYLKANGYSGMSDVRVFDLFTSDGTTEAQLPLVFPGKKTFAYDGIVDLPSHLTEAGFVASRTMDLLRDMKDGPFFITAGFWGPHHPAMPSPEFAGTHDPSLISPWKNFKDDLSGKPRIQKRYAERLHPRLTHAPWSDWQRMIARHFDLTAMIDNAIGKIMRELSALGLAEKTTVILTADHGDTLGCHGGQFDKGPYMYEETYRIPLLIRLPHETKRHRVKDFASLMDLYPTILDLADVPVPPGTDATSLLPILSGGRGTRDCVTGQFFGFDSRGYHYQQMIRMGKHKYIFNPSDLDELYDLESDPAEMENLVDDLKSREVLERLKRRLLAEMKRTQDPFSPFAADLMGMI